MNLLQYSKALVVVLLAVLTPILGAVGITADTTVSQAITLLVTAGIVFLVPNDQKKN